MENKNETKLVEFFCSRADAEIMLEESLAHVKEEKVAVNEHHLENVLQKTEPLARRIAFELENSVTTREDFFQEMQIEQLKVIRKISEPKSFDDLVCICLSSLKTYRLYGFRQNARMVDKASSSVDFAEIQDWTKTPFESSEVVYFKKELMRNVIKKVEEVDSKYPGILRFFNEALEPSSETLDKVEIYKKNISNPRGLAGNGTQIPPLVLANVLGITPGKLKTFKECLARIFVKSGVSEKYVRSFYQFGN